MSGGEGLEEALDLYNNPLNRPSFQRHQELDAKPNGITNFDAEIQRVRDLIDKA